MRFLLRTTTANNVTIIDGGGISNEGSSRTARVQDKHVMGLGYCFV